MFRVRAPAKAGPTRRRQLTVRRQVTVLLAACLVLVALPGTASSAPSRKKAIWGPVTRNGASQFPIYRDLGAGIYLTKLSWAATAPTRPGTPKDPADSAYRWPADL